MLIYGRDNGGGFDGINGIPLFRGVEGCTDPSTAQWMGLRANLADSTAEG
jgi:hypothetical protein